MSTMILPCRPAFGDELGIEYMFQWLMLSVFERAVLPEEIAGLMVGNFLAQLDL